jgi:hypothetical protein
MNERKWETCGEDQTDGPNANLRLRAVVLLFCDSCEALSERERHLRLRPPPPPRSSAAQPGQNQKKTNAATTVGQNKQKRYQPKVQPRLLSRRPLSVSYCALFLLLKLSPGVYLFTYIYIYIQILLFEQCSVQYRIVQNNVFCKL